MPICEPIKKSLEYMNLYNVQSVLEVGCGKGGILAQFAAPVKIGVDNFTPFMEYAARTYASDAIYIKHDIRELLNIFMPQSFDAVIGFDILEHLPQVDLFPVMQACEDLARKLVIFFGPLDEAGLAMQPDPIEGNDGMRHITILRSRYFTDRGYQIFTWPAYYRNQVTAMLAIKEM